MREKMVWHGKHLFAFSRNPSMAFSISIRWLIGTPTLTECVWLSAIEKAKLLQHFHGTSTAIRERGREKINVQVNLIHTSKWIYFQSLFFFSSMETTTKSYNFPRNSSEDKQFFVAFMSTNKTLNCNKNQWRNEINVKIRKEIIAWKQEFVKFIIGLLFGSRRKKNNFLLKFLGAKQWQWQ